MRSDETIFHLEGFNPSDWVAVPHRPECADGTDFSRGYFYVRAGTMWCWKAYAVAAERLDTSSFTKMLLTCRATVFSLIERSCAIARFDLPHAMSFSTSISRAVRGLSSGFAGERLAASRPARSWAAPSTVNARWAAVN